MEGLIFGILRYSYLFFLHTCTVLTRFLVIGLILVVPKDP